MRCAYPVVAIATEMVPPKRIRNNNNKVHNILLEIDKGMSLTFSVMIASGIRAVKGSTTRQPGFVGGFWNGADILISCSTRHDGNTPGTDG